MTTKEMPPDDMVRATLRGRIGISALVLCLIVLVAIFQLFVFPLMNTTFAANPSTENILLLRWILAGLALSGILPALIMIATGLRARRSGRFPLAGAWVLRNTKIKRGIDALRIGSLCIASGVITCMICAGAAVYIWTAIDRLNSEQSLSPGVIILKQTPGAKP